MHHRYLQLLSVVFCAALPVLSASSEPTGGVLGKAPATVGQGREVKLASSANTTGASNPLRGVIARNWTIAAGDYVVFEWPVDLSGADKVNISVTTLGDLNSRLTKVRFGVAFAAPADWYVITDMVLGSSFSLSDHGGFTVPVYGPFIKVVVYNDGATPVQITQLAAYAVAR